MERLAYLPRSSQRLLKETTARIRRQAYGDNPSYDPPTAPAPEIFIAQIPSTGIPGAIADLSTGYEYQMGKVKCNIFYAKRITETNPDSNTVLREIFEHTTTNFKEYVYNPYRYRNYGQVAAAVGSEPTWIYTIVTRDRSGFFVCARPPDILKAKTTVAIAAGGIDLVSIYRGGSDTGMVEYARNNWAHGGTAIPIAQECYIKYFDDERQWVIIRVGGSAAGGIPFHNSSTDPAPAHGVLWNSGAGEVVITGVTYLELSNPFDTFDIRWYVNRDSVVAANGVGLCDTFHERPGPVRIDASLVGLVNIGNELGPKPNSFTIWPGRPGFTAVGSDYTLDGVFVVDCVQRPVTRVFGRLYSDLTQNAAGTATAQFEIWYRNSSGSRGAAGWGEKLTVYGTLMNKDEKAKAGTFGFADYMTNDSGTWEGDFACDPSNTEDSQSMSPGASPSQDFAFSGSDTSASSPEPISTGII